MVPTCWWKRHEKQITTLTCWPFSKNTKQMHWNIQVRLIFNHFSCCSVVLSPDIVVFVHNTYTVESFLYARFNGRYYGKASSVCLFVAPQSIRLCPRLTDSGTTPQSIWQIPRHAFSGTTPFGSTLSTCCMSVASSR